MVRILALRPTRVTGLEGRRLAVARRRDKRGDNSESNRPMEIFLDKRAVRQIRLSAQDAVEEGDIETLREDILEAFSEEQVEEIERRLDTGDFFEFLTDLLDEWSGDDADELFELLDTQLGDVGVDLKFEKRGSPEVEAEAEEDETTDFEDEDFEDGDDEDDDEDDEEEEEEEEKETE
jgi:hypothetical protein